MISQLLESLAFARSRPLAIANMQEGRFVIFLTSDGRRNTRIHAARNQANGQRLCAFLLISVAYRLVTPAHNSLPSVISHMLLINIRAQITNFKLQITNGKSDFKHRARRVPKCIYAVVTACEPS